MGRKFSTHQDLRRRQFPVIRDCMLRHKWRPVADWRWNQVFPDVRPPALCPGFCRNCMHLSQSLDLFLDEGQLRREAPSEEGWRGGRWGFEMGCGSIQWQILTKEGRRMKMWWGYEEVSLRPTVQIDGVWSPISLVHSDMTVSMVDEVPDEVCGTVSYFLNQV